MTASGRYLLDTNVIIAVLEGEPAAYSNLEYAAEVFVPAIALGELFFGAAKSGRPEQNRERLERFAAGRFVISPDLNVARVYGRIKHNLKRNGRPLPENDIWIAASAIAYSLILVTRDRHFHEIEELQTVDWASNP